MVQLEATLTQDTKHVFTSGFAGGLIEECLPNTPIPVTFSIVWYPEPYRVGPAHLSLQIGGSTIFLDVRLRPAKTRLV
jgi:hypothetical protein